MFTDTNKTWPNYSPKGDFSVKPGSPALALGFRNFPMDSFGVISLPMTGTKWNQPVDHPNSLKNLHGVVRYVMGKLNVSFACEYRVTVTTALGRVVKIYDGKGYSSYNLSSKLPGAGIYLVTVRTNSSVDTRQFIIN
jgi:hypothetical protein